LDLSKIESGRLELHPEPFRVADAMAETIASLRPLADHKNIRISNVADPALTISADRLRFKEILSNLLSNGIKFTPEKGRITVECEERPDGILFVVSDTGIGIAPSEQLAIFDKFYQLGSTTRGIREGTGLGLAITKSLVEMHGGRIWVESQPGEGSRFHFVLPRSIAESQLAGRFGAGKPPGPIVLIGMNEYEPRMANFLNHKGWEVVFADTVEEAFAIGRTTDPAALILDLAVLKPENWLIFQDFRSSEDTARIPILTLVTAAHRSSAESLGANAALTKPIDPALLLDTLGRVVSYHPGESARILVVEDESEARQLLEATLRSARLLPVLASTAKQALEMLARSPISALIVDLSRPELSGFELLFRIRQNTSFDQLPIVVLTANEKDREDTRILSRQGNTLFLEAPTWMQDFPAKLYEVLLPLIKH
jgi:DNA-binding response OmpR family regulator/two-component sensor histidine kinase